MTWSTPDVYTVGEVLTSTSMNKISTNLNAGMGAIYDTTLSVSAAQFDFTSIPQTFAHLLVVQYLRDDSAGTDFNGSKGRFNGDSGANYDYNFLQGANSTATSGMSAAQTSGIMGEEVAGGATASRFGVAVSLIPAYTQTVGHKSVFTATGTTAVTAATSVAALWAFAWRSTAAITRLTILPSAGTNFVAGSRVTIYGLGS